ncbi:MULTISPECIES: hypothetical protein [unclassified Glutamicibacter]|uniref:hypothetical protein n=1 Tax=unclassified Glutamicibacter TaxID=2627139 RepID=UPI0011610D2E|nr:MULTISPECIES: hypothetical protein [unclassified Glutamicibacter]QEP08368.1 hypothetical protein F0M17_14540 [Glutamicibacter sp. ZJUTW]
MRITTSAVLCGASTALLALTALVPASAAPPEKTDSIWLSGEVAHVGELDGFAGNAHLISFFARTTGSGDAAVVNFDCPAGELPSWDPDSGCETLDIVGMYGDALEVHIDKQLKNGSVSGSVRAYQGEDENGEPIWGETYQLEAVMAGTGDAVITREHQEGFRHWSKDRPAAATSGQLGDMDLAGAVGNIGHLKESFKY